MARLKKGTKSRRKGRLAIMGGTARKHTAGTGSSGRRKKYAGGRRALRFIRVIRANMRHTGIGRSGTGNKSVHASARKHTVGTGSSAVRRKKRASGRRVNKRRTNSMTAMFYRGDIAALKAVAGIAALLLLTVIVRTVYISADDGLSINTINLAELKAPYGDVVTLRTLASRFGLSFDELLTLYLAENNFFPERGTRTADDQLERIYILNYNELRDKYVDKLRTYRELIGRLIEEIVCFPVVRENSGSTELMSADNYGYMYGDGFTLSGTLHTGVDIYDRENAPGRLTVVSVCDGVIETAGENKTDGKYVVVFSNNGNRYYYCHLNTLSGEAMTGVKVRAGQELGKMGATGTSCGAGGLNVCLHMGVKIKTKTLGELWLNPYIFLRLAEDAD